MKKVHVLICIIIIILLVGCSSETVNKGGINVYDKLKSQLSLIPKEYSVDNAVKDGCFVILHEDVKSKLEIMDKFVSDSQKGKSTAITIAQYTIKGDIIITKIIYDGIKYYGVEDDSRCSSGNIGQHQFEYKYLKIFEANERKAYYLFNDNTITYSKLIKSSESSNSKDFIEHTIICQYKN